MRKPMRIVMTALVLLCCVLAGFLAVNLTETPIGQLPVFDAENMTYTQVMTSFTTRQMKTAAAVIGTISVTLLAWLMTAKKPKLHWVTFILLTTVGLTAAVLKPALEMWYSWDEEVHYETMMTMIGGSDGSLETAVNGMSLWGLGYIPTMIGMLLARLFGQDGTTQYLIGVCLNVLAYAGLCALAVKHAPKYKLSVLIVSAVPISLFLAASCSYDSMVIAAGLLGVALLMETHAMPGEISGLRALTLMSVFSLGMLAKPVYCLLLLLLLTLPKGKFGTGRRAWAFRIFVLALLVWCMASLLLPGPYDSVKNGDSRYGDADAARQIAFITGDPAGALGVLGAYMQAEWLKLHTEAATSWAYAGVQMQVMWGLIAAALLIAPLYSADEEAPSMLTARRRLLMAGLVELVLLILTVTQYIVSSPQYGIEGMQPRYAVPMYILMLLTLMLPERLRRAARPLSGRIGFALVTVLGMGSFLYTGWMLFVRLPVTIV